MRTIKELFKKKIRFIVSAVALLILCSFSLVSAATTYPKPTTLKYVNDYNNTLDDSTKEYIVSVGKELEDKTGAQEVVIVVDSLEGQDINNYANEIFREWGIGQKDKNNGLLVLVSIKDRKWRVEVGTGLEGALPDIYTARVMDSVAQPKFKEENYSEGIKEAYSLFADSIAKEYNVSLDKNEKVTLPENSPETAAATNNTNTGMVGILIVIALIVLDFIFNRGRITLLIINLLFLSGRHGGGGGGNGSGWGGNDGGGNDGGGFGGMGGGSSSGGGSSGGW